MIGIEEEVVVTPKEIVRTNPTARPLNPALQRTLLLAARMLSSIFRPNYYPTVAFIVLFTCTYLQMLPWRFCVYTTFMVYSLTVLFPYFGIYWYRQIKGWRIEELRKKHRRLVPYLINIVCYLACYHFVHSLGLPSFVLAIIAMSVLVQCICTLTNVWWKVSMHAAGAGTLIGAIAGYSLLFAFNGIWWLCFAILVSGLVSSSRMLLRQHSLGQVLGGTWIGILSAIIVILWI